ncbi:Rho guanyl nucleotide exchange factor, putative [Aspergillus lentulus]|nr:Rho guanyl nucleotide exchange factor, putative [Aspergillus lentulus]
MEESKEDTLSETPLLLVEPPNSDVKVVDTRDSVHDSGGRTTDSGSFRRWFEEFWLKRSLPSPAQKHVDGWPEILLTKCSNDDWSPHCGLQDQQWEQLSAHSSHLGIVKTASFTDQSVGRSRAATQSTFNPSIHSGGRGSIESLRPSVSPSISHAALLHSLERRQILREIITTETDYVFGLKALADVLLICSVRPRIYRNVQQIRELHQTFLARARAVSPKSVSAASEVDKLFPQGVAKGLRAIDLKRLNNLQSRSLRKQSLKTSIIAHLNSLAAQGSEAYDIAYEIAELSKSFKLYEDFCSNFELLLQDVSLLRGSIPNWETFEGGIESLAKSVTSLENKLLTDNRSMSLSDLVVKVFPTPPSRSTISALTSLSQFSAFVNDPLSHEKIKEVLDGLRPTIERVNQANETLKQRELIAKTLLLREKLELPEPGSGMQDIVHDIYLQLGPIKLCGVLHATYQLPADIVGEYVVCALFESYLVLAASRDGCSRLQAMACLYVRDLKIDTLRNGRGLCCYGCLFSWKLIFEHRNNQYELVFSASSAIEEKQWKTEILRAAAASTEVSTAGQSESSLYSFEVLGLLPLECSTGLTTLLSRKTSIHSLATSASKANLQHIVIRKTHRPGEASPEADGEIERPKIPPWASALVLTTRRQDRVDLERFIFNIYTKSSLPYPGMPPAKGKDLLKPSKLMVAIREGVYRRSSSGGLPTARRPAIVLAPAKTSKNEQIGRAEKDRTDESPVIEDKKKAASPMSRMGTVRRALTVRFQARHKSASHADLPLQYKGQSDQPFPKVSVRGIFNSVSRRSSKRGLHLALSVDGGA